MLKTVAWDNGEIVLIDQTRLPHELAYLHLKTYQEIANAIRTMQVRGAPAIGVTAALGMALGANAVSPNTPRSLFDTHLSKVANELAATRPTAVNLFWAIHRVHQLGMDHSDWPTSRVQEAMQELAIAMIEEDIELNRAIGRHGSTLVPEDANVLTHCNAGSLACAGYGTALGVIRGAVEQGKKVHVYADETRPRLQGASLTCWELKNDNIPVTLIADNAAGSLMRQGKVDLVVVGADRIAANGDTANKLGTYQVAVLARENNVPFYVAAPFSTVDFSLPSGESIPIEERDQIEVTHIGGQAIAPQGVPAWNPAFDVTPARYIAGIITECGVALPPFIDSLTHLSNSESPALKHS